MLFGNYKMCKLCPPAEGEFPVHVYVKKKILLCNINFRAAKTTERLATQASS